MTERLRRRLLASVVGLLALATLALYLIGWQPLATLAIILRSGPQRPGMLRLDLRENARVTPEGSPSRTSNQPSNPADWPSYNRTLTSERYSPLSQIDTHSVSHLKVLCTYDTRLVEDRKSVV